MKVLLDGQGSDEIFAGYHYFFAYYFKELLLRLQIIKLEPSWFDEGSLEAWLRNNEDLN